MTVRAGCASARPSCRSLDVRERAEWKRGHIPGSMHMPYHDIDAMPDGIDPERPVAVVCASGQRAAVAASLLARYGATPCRACRRRRRRHVGAAPGIRSSAEAGVRPFGANCGCSPPFAPDAAATAPAAARSASAQAPRAPRACRRRSPSRGARIRCGYAPIASGPGARRRRPAARRLRRSSAAERDRVAGHAVVDGPRARVCAPCSRGEVGEAAR